MANIESDSDSLSSDSDDDAAKKDLLDKDSAKAALGKKGKAPLTKEQRSAKYELRRMQLVSRAVAGQGRRTTTALPDTRSSNSPRCVATASAR